MIEMVLRFVDNSLFRRLKKCESEGEKYRIKQK